MKLLAATIATLSLMVVSSARADRRRGAVDDLGSVAPQLEKYAQGPVGDLWKRPGCRHATAASSPWQR